MTKGLLVICLRDIRAFFADFYGVGFRTVYVALDTLVFAFVLSQVVPPEAVGGTSYLQYFAVGALAISVFWASYNIGRDVYWDRESGYLNYLLSLPISRNDIIIGRSLGGSLRAIFNAIPLYVLVVALVPTRGLNLIESVAILFIFSLGLCGLGITIALSVREQTRARLLNTFLSLTLIRSSTAMYPAVAMPPWLQVGTKLNPVTYASDSIRAVIVSVPASDFPLNDVAIVVAFTLISGLLGSWLLSNMIEGGPTR